MIARPPQSGFSLVELSIVLVILGLLTGGILAGQSLIRAAELRSVSTEYNRYVTASQTFRDKYFAIPGDITNATAFWGTTASCPGTAGTGTQTCNGNGNGQINFGGGANQYSELFTFWQHLANAGLIEGNYTGIGGAGSVHTSLATNSPKSRISSGYWSALTWGGPITGQASFFDGNYGDNYLELGGLIATSLAETGLLKPEEIWNLDAKMDDGKPATGFVRVRHPTLCTNAVDTTVMTADYGFTSTSLCIPIFTLK